MAGGIVEEFFLPFVLGHARSGLSLDDGQLRSLLGFAAEDLSPTARARVKDAAGALC